MVDQKGIFMVKSNVALIIVTSNSSEMTQQMLTEVSKLNTPNLNCICIVVDNCSVDKTKEVLSEFKLPNMDYKYLRNNENLGYAGGNNTGISYALKNNFDYILVMNNDLILSSDLLVKMINFMNKNKDVGIASPKIYFANGYEFHKGRYKQNDLGNVIWYAGGDIDSGNVYTSHNGVDQVDSGQFNKIVNTDVASGACMIIRKEVFNKIGLLDDSLFLYWEDADFSRRAINNGFKVVYFPDTCIWHKVSSSTGGSGSATNDYFLTRNRFYYSMRYSIFRTKFAVIRDTIKLLIVGRKWQKIGAFDALLGVKGKGLWKYHA